MTHNKDRAKTDTLVAAARTFLEVLEAARGSLSTEVQTAADAFGQKVNDYDRDDTI